MVNITTKLNIRHCSRLDFSKMTMAVFSMPHAFPETSTPHQEVGSIFPSLQPGWVLSPDHTKDTVPSGHSPPPSAHISLPLAVPLWSPEPPREKAGYLEVLMLETQCRETTKTQGERCPGSPSYPALRRCPSQRDPHRLSEWTSHRRFPAQPSSLPAEAETSGPCCACSNSRPTESRSVINSYFHHYVLGADC